MLDLPSNRLFITKKNKTCLLNRLIIVTLS